MVRSSWWLVAAIWSRFYACGLVPARRVARIRTRMTKASMSSEEDPILQIPTLEARLATVVNEADAETVTELSEELSGLRLSAEMSVLSANSQFYEAFTESDLKKMRDLWCDSEDASCTASNEGGECLSRPNQWESHDSRSCRWW